MLEIQEEDNLNQLQKKLKTIAFTSLAVVLVLFILGAWKSYDISQDIAAGKTELKNTKAELEDTKKAIADGSEQIAKQKTEIQENEELIKGQKIMLGNFFDKADKTVTNEVLEKTPKNVAREVLINNPIIAKSISSRIYLQIGEESQRARAERLQKALQVKGFIVPGIENVGSKAPANTDLRYCKDKSPSDIDKIKSVFYGENILLKEILIQDCGVGGYEIWFGGDFKGQTKAGKPVIPIYDLGKLPDLTPAPKKPSVVKIDPRKPPVIKLVPKKSTNKTP